MKFKSFILSALSLISLLAFGQKTLSPSQQKSVKTVAPQSIESYLLIQKQLAADSLEGVLSAAVKIHKNEKDELSKVSLLLSRSKNIDEARENFKKLSSLLILSTSEKDRNGARVAYCPMAQARWLQLGDSLKNPYYGSSMLECGRFEDTKPSQK